MTAGHFKLGEILVNLELIEPVQLSAALAAQKAFGGRLGSHLVRMGVIAESKLMDVIAQQISIPKVNLRRSHIRVDALALVKKDICQKYCLFPVAKKLKGNAIHLLIAMSDPTDIEAIRTVEFAGNCRVSAAIATENDILRLIEFCYTDQGLKECRGEEDLKSGFSVDLSETPADDFVILSSEGDPASMMNYKLDPTVRDLIDLLVRKRIITWEESQHLLRRIK